jgi:eukaryotic-like serine/threonine-protein kinase
MKKIGRYEILEELGRGAMGVVYKASDPTIGRLVAIKLLLLARPAQSGLPGVKDIFLREARAAGRLSHPGIVTVHDALEDQEMQSCYIVMEFVPGRTLEKALLAGPPFTVEQSLSIARQIAEALDYAHREKIIHRDLKPANILLTEDGRAKITDFGIAKVVATEDAQRTLAIMGTPAYMSPEQVTGGEMDASSDLFSLGILLYLMLTGEKPFSGDTAAVMFKIAYQDPAPPSQVRGELSKGHDFLLLRALAKDKKKRYGSAREFLDDLDDIEHGRPPRSESKVPMSELHAGDLTVRASRPLVPALKSAPAAAPRKPVAIWAASATALLVILAAGVWFARHRSVAPPAAMVQPQAISQANAPPPASAPAPSTAPAPVAAVVPSKPEPPSAEKAKAAQSSRPRKREAASEKSRTETVAAANEPVTPQTPAPLPLTPTQIPKSAAPAPAPAKPAPSAAAVTIQLECRYEFQQAQLALTADGQNLVLVNLQGRRAGKFLGLRHGYEGTFLRPVTVPSGTSRLSVHFQTADGSTNMTGVIAMTPSAGKTAVLHVNATSRELKLSW